MVAIAFLPGIYSHYIVEFQDQAYVCTAAEEIFSQSNLEMFLFRWIVMPLKVKVLQAVMVFGSLFFENWFCWAPVNYPFLLIKFLCVACVQTLLIPFPYFSYFSPPNCFAVVEQSRATPSAQLHFPLFSWKSLFYIYPAPWGSSWLFFSSQLQSASTLWNVVCPFL